MPSDEMLLNEKSSDMAIAHIGAFAMIASILSAADADICHTKPYEFGSLRLCYPVVREA